MKNLHFVSLINILLLSVLLSSCGEFSYKRGATSADLESTRKNCQAEQASVAVETCLQNSGWTVQKLDAIGAFEETTLKSTETVSPTTNTTLTQADAIENTNEIKTAETKTKSAAITNTTEKTSKKVLVVTSKPEPADPLDTFVVSSWWKFGVNADAFRTDSNSCVSTLGDAHKPIASTQTATAGFIVCMREKGWKAIKKAKN